MTYPQPSPPRHSNISIDPPATSSPTSVVLDRSSSLDAVYSDSLDSPCSAENNEPVFELPSVTQIASELQTLSRQSARSKASYRVKLGKMASELYDATKVVYDLEQELCAAKEKQAAAQSAIEDAKQKREVDNERLIVRTLQLQILRKCMAEPDGCCSDEIHHIREKQMSDDCVLYGSERYAEFSLLELAGIRRRLEDILALLNKADTASVSKNFETRAKAASMKREAISTYILFHKCT